MSDVTANIIGAAWHPALIGKARRICSDSKKFLQNFFFLRCALPIGRVRIAEPIVLAQHKRNERIGEARMTTLSTSPIVLEIAY